MREPCRKMATGRKVFGVANVALAFRVPSTLEALRSAVGRLVEGRAVPSFRISARRAFKSYPLTSVELIYTG